MHWSRLLQRMGLAAVLIGPSAALAQKVVTAVVPVVGTVPGGYGTIWRTEVTLSNYTGADAFVALQLVSDPEQSFFSTMLSVGDSLTFSDVSQEAFGKSGILSPLLVQTVGERSVTVSAAAHAVQDDRLTAPQAIPVIYGEFPRATQRLGPVASNQQYRTNIGLVNLGDDPASFTLSVQRIAGRNLAVTTITVPPRRMVHSTIPTLFPLLEEASDLTIVVDPGSPNTFAYASMIRNSDQSARFFTPH